MSNTEQIGFGLCCGIAAYYWTTWLTLNGFDGSSKGGLLWYGRTGDRPHKFIDLDGWQIAALVSKWVFPLLCLGFALSMVAAGGAQVTGNWCWNQTVIADSNFFTQGNQNFLFVLLIFDVSALVLSYAYKRADQQERERRALSKDSLVETFKPNEAPELGRIAARKVPDAVGVVDDRRKADPVGQDGAMPWPWKIEVEAAKDYGNADRYLTQYMTNTGVHIGRRQREVVVANLVAISATYACWDLGWFTSPMGRAAGFELQPWFPTSVSFAILFSIYLICNHLAHTNVERQLFVVHHGLYNSNFNGAIVGYALNYSIILAWNVWSIYIMSEYYRSYANLGLYAFFCVLVPLTLAGAHGSWAYWWEQSNIARTFFFCVAFFFNLTCFPNQPYFLQLTTFSSGNPFQNPPAVYSSLNANVFGYNWDSMRLENLTNVIVMMFMLCLPVIISIAKTWVMEIERKAVEKNRS